jgi:putative peptidoglycan lipid II flippase
MLKSSGAMGAATLSSRVLGLGREIVYAWFMGDGPVAGAFKLAFMIPNLFRRLLGEGALTAAFIPQFKEKEALAGPGEMWRAANAVLSGLLIAAAIIVMLVMAAISVALPLGWFSTETVLMLRLLRLMFPYMLLVCVAATFMAMLNARGQFFIPAMGATMLNVVMIFSVLVIAPRMGATVETQIFGLAIGVLLAGVAQAGFQWPALRREGFRYAWVNPWGNDTVRVVLVRMVPGTVGVAAFQINMLVTQGVAYWVDPRIIASFDYAVRLMELPQGVFGISLATYLLPTLSAFAARKDYDGFGTTLKQGLGHLVFLNLIAAVGLCVLAEPIVRLLYERGDFSAGSTQRTAFALATLALGLVAFSTVNILARAFFALGDTQTPMRISVVCLGLNLILTLWLVIPFKQGGMGLANSLTACVNAWLLQYALRRKLRRLEFRGLIERFWRLLPAALLAGLAGWGASHLLREALGTAGWGPRLAAVLIPMAIAGTIYFGLGFWLQDPSAREMVNLAVSRLRRSRGGP